MFFLLGFIFSLLNYLINSGHRLSLWWLYFFKLVLYSLGTDAFSSWRISLSHTCTYHHFTHCKFISCFHFFLHLLKQLRLVHLCNSLCITWQIIGLDLSLGSFVTIMFLVIQVYRFLSTIKLLKTWMVEVLYFFITGMIDHLIIWAINLVIYLLLCDFW